MEYVLAWLYLSGVVSAWGELDKKDRRASPMPALVVALLAPLFVPLIAAYAVWFRKADRR